MSSRALIAGGSLAGLFSAAAVHDRFDEVVLLERDTLPDGPEHRAGVPQGRQVHALLAIGFETMNALLPGLGTELEEAAGGRFDSAAEIAIYTANGWLARVESDAKVVGLRRPELEWIVRRRVLALPNVRLRSANVRGLLATDDGRRVTGVTCADGSELHGELVIDATGRASRAGSWIEDLGYERPAEVHLRSYVGYATVAVELPDDALPEGVSAVLAHPNPDNPRGAAVLPCGSGRHLLAALGMMRHHPSTERDEFLAHLDAAPSPLVGRIARKATFLEGISAYRMPGTQRRLWEELVARPEGFLVIGDAVMSPNPLYGQGMSVAAVQASQLLEALAAQPGTLDGLADRAQPRITAAAVPPFEMVVGTDSAYRGATFIGLEPPDQASSDYRRALGQLATEDAQASLAMKYASHYFDLTALRDDELQAKVAAWQADGRQVTASDPEVIPPRVTG